MVSRKNDNYRARRKFGALSGVAGLAVLAACGAGTSSEGEEEDYSTLSYGCTSASSGAYAKCVAMAKVLQEELPGTSVEVVETGAGVENVRRFARDEFDIILAAGPTAQNAYEGIGDEWEEEPATDLRYLVMDLVIPQTWVVRSDAGISSPTALEGEEFNLGLRGSESEALSSRVMDAMGIQVDPFVGDTADAVNAMKNRAIAGYVKSANGFAGLDTSTLDIMATQDVEVLDFPEDLQAKVSEELPQLVWAETGGWDEYPEKFNTYLLIAGDGISANIPQERVYDLAKAFYENIDTIAASYSGYASEQFDAVGQTTEYCAGTPIPLHAGVVQYLEESGTDVPSECIPEEYRSVG
jgi:TRAP transporter TAXI family solute receptor